MFEMSRKTELTFWLDKDTLSALSRIAADYVLAFLPCVESLLPKNNTNVDMTITRRQLTLTFRARFFKTNDIVR